MERKLEASAATDPKIAGGGDGGVDLTVEDEKILDRAWGRIADDD